MANPGVGYRTANDVLMEVSLHLCQSCVYTTLTVALASTGSQTVTVGTSAAMYAGAQVVVGRGTANQEVVTVTAVPSGTQFTAVFANTHASGVQVMAPTFPDQNATDPLWTQAEMLMYLSRAQNQFLTDVPCYYTTTTQSLVTGTRYQSLPTTAIQAERIAVSQYSLYCTSLTRTSGTVTVTTEDAHGLSAGQGITIVNATADTTFNGVFQVALVPTSTTLTYQQYASDASISGSPAASIQYYLRMYASTQEALNQSQRGLAMTSGVPRYWAEDRTGLYGYAVLPSPNSTYPLQLLCATRDSDSLALTDGFLVPDPMIHYVKYLTLAYALSKDGVQSSPELVKYCLSRYEAGVKVGQMYTGWMKEEAR